MQGLEDKNEPKRSSISESLKKNLDAVDVFIQGIAEKHELSFEEILNLLKGKPIQISTDILIPTFIFRNKNLGILESVVKYLKEEHKLAYHQIAIILKRDDRVIWVTYNKAFRKNMERLRVESPNYWVPVSVFTDKVLGPLESLSKYFIETARMDMDKISKLLERGPRSISMCYKRAKEKENGLKN